MDSLIARRRALAAGDPLGTLKRIALRDDPLALARKAFACTAIVGHARCAGRLTLTSVS
jgi:hypothetical protein